MHSSVHLNMLCPNALSIDHKSTVGYQVDAKLLPHLELCVYCRARLRRHGAMATQGCLPRMLMLEGDNDKVEFIIVMK